MRRNLAHSRKGHAIYEPQDIGDLVESIEKALGESGLGVGLLDLAREDIGWNRRDGQDTTRGATSRNAEIRRAREFAERDPLAIQGLRIHQVFILGRGFSVKAEDDKAQQTIDDLFSSPRNKSTLAFDGLNETLERLLVDGSRAIALADTGNGEVVVRRIDTTEITKIVRDPEDAGTVWGYQREWFDQKNKHRKVFYRDLSAPDEVTVPEEFEEQEGVVIRWGPYGRFGGSIVVPSMIWSKAHKQFLSARAIIQRALARFAWKQKLDGGANAVAAAISAQQSGLSTARGIENNPGPAPGSTWVENQGSNLTPIKTDTGAGGAQIDGDMLLQAAILPYGLMPHWFGSGTAAKFSTSDNMELPMLRMLEAGQKREEELYRDIIDFTLKVNDLEGAAYEITFPELDKRNLSAFMEGVQKATTAVPALSESLAVQQLILAALGVSKPAEEIEQLPDKEGEPEDPAAQAVREVRKIAEALRREA